MSNFSDQVSDFQHKWMEQQQAWMNDWLDTLENMRGGTPPDTWKQAVDVIEQQVKSTLETQRQSLLTLAENKDYAKDMPESMGQWLDQMEEGITKWSDMQQQLWDNWFEMLRSSAPAGDQSGDLMFKHWQDFADRALAMQREWLSAWEDTQPKAKKAKKKTSKPAPDAGKPGPGQ